MMEVFGFIFLHQTTVLATETSSKMASTLRQNWVTPSCRNAENFMLFRLSNSVQILLACGINTSYGITNGISEFQCQH